LVTLEDIRVAQARISKYVRRTPIIEAHPVKQSITPARALYLKLECLQIVGSFKARGAVNKLYSLPPEQLTQGIIAASGGNHGLGVAYAGWLAHAPTTIYLPRNTPPIKGEKIRAWGANVVSAGEVFDDANQIALQVAERDGLAFFHPFADAAVIAGQGTIALEIMQDLAEIDVLVVAIGGGGLISGISIAAKALNPRIKIIGVEPTGAPKIYESLQAGHVIELEQIHTAANTLAPRASAPINFEIIRQFVDEVVLVSDEAMHAAARWLWLEMNVAAELSGSAAVAALMSGAVSIKASDKVCALVCGAGTEATGDH
jgi:threonine dehydratase